MEEILLNIDSRIELLLTEKVRIDKELKGLRAMRKEIERKIKVPKMIKRYELCCPDGIEHTIDSLVKINETFEEWVNRFGSKCKGGKDPEWLKSMYKKCGFSSNNYLNWLVEVDDKRVIDTEFYLKKKKDHSNV